MDKETLIKEKEETEKKLNLINQQIEECSKREYKEQFHKNLVDALNLRLKEVQRLYNIKENINIDNGKFFKLFCYLTEPFVKIYHDTFNYVAENISADKKVRAENIPSLIAEMLIEFKPFYDSQDIRDIILETEEK